MESIGHKSLGVSRDDIGFGRFVSIWDELNLLLQNGRGEGRGIWERRRGFADAGAEASVGP